MAKDFASMEDSNRSSNPHIDALSDPARRTWLRGGLGATVTGLLAPLSGVASLAGCATIGAAGPLLGFKSVPVSIEDRISVPVGYSAEVTDAHPGLASLADRDRALVRKLVATVLRRVGTLRHLLAKFLESGFPSDAPRVETVLLIGAAQILFLDVPDHAAVDLSVRLVQADRRAAKYPGLINAVLRRVAREGKDAIAALDPVPLDTPDWLFARWQRTYGEETARAIAIAHGHEPPLDLTVKSEAESWAQRLRGARDADRHGAHRHARPCRAAPRLSRRRLVGAGRSRRTPRAAVRRRRGQDKSPICARRPAARPRSLHKPARA